MRFPILMALIGLSLAACSSGPRDRLAGDTPPPVAQEVDLDRYLGLWFEIARADHGFEQDCHGVTAFYEYREDGDLRVINRCWKNSLDGEMDVAEGHARLANPVTNAKLEVSFFGPFYGDYWILDVAEDYSWAVVSEPAGRYIWILSREPQPGDAFIAERLQFLNGLGYDTEGLIFPDQWASVDAMPREGLPE